MDNVDDLLGVVPTGTNVAQQAAQYGVNAALAAPTEVEETERRVVAKLRKEYDSARDFDKKMRDQYIRDRLYAGGEADDAWASDANLIGSFIDILVSFLYAKNPDVGVRAAKRAGAQPDNEATLFAETMQLVISRLWKDAKLKKACKKLVRSALSVGIGWIKAVCFSEYKTDPQVEGRLRDAQASLARLEAMEGEYAEGQCEDPEVKRAEIEMQIQGLQAKLEKLFKNGLNIDFVRAEDMQVSLDVSDLSDYLEADWNSNDLYIPKTALQERFKRFTEEDIGKAAVYYQRQQMDREALKPDSTFNGEGQFTKSPTSSVMGGDKPFEFVKVVELWDKRDGLVKTFVDGVDKWAVEPYPPPQASNRFYPYLQLAVYPVDGKRAPQSLPYRLRKLQDEYSQARSGQRATRERSIPGTVFNAGAIPPESAKKLENAVHGEYVGLDLTDPTANIQNVIAAKPRAEMDVRLFDTTAIVNDMQMLSGVQEALAAGSSTAKTATEAGIEEAGRASRTGSQRDNLEEMLTELAQYTAETSIQEIKPETAQRIAGMQAFWPYGMDVQDVLTMVDVDIDAGSTGKPNQAADRESWGIILPQVKETMVQYRQMQLTDPEMAVCLRNLLKETLRRLDDRLDIDQILPAMAPTLPVLPGAVPGMVPGAPGTAPGATGPGKPAPATLNPSAAVPPAGITPV